MKEEALEAKDDGRKFFKVFLLFVVDATIK